MHIPTAALGVLLSGAAIGGLWLAWRGHGRPWLLASIVAGTVALLLWVRLQGAEFGTLYALGAGALVAWAWIGLTATPAGGTVAVDRPRHTAAPSPAALLRGLGTAALTGPMALLAAGVACLHIVYWLPAGPAGRWVTAAFALPLLWAVLATLLLCTDRRPRAALALGVAAGLGALLLPSGSLP
ncbi:MAG: hypothetical protein ACOY6E_14215 [Pseudomonadota bacterium]|jgi:hypothetical protein